jgi:hypothetical protein
MKGIYLLALGHSNYGKMAATLAASIKMVDKKIQIAVFTCCDALSQLNYEELGLFDHIIELESFYYTNNDGSFNPIKARLYAYQQTPFDKTLCIDVDNIWISTTTVTELMNKLSKISFTIANNGYTIAGENAEAKYSPWADITAVTQAYEIEGKRFYNTSGEWFYFKKNETARDFFELAQNIFNSAPSIKVSTFIGQAIPDELAFSIAIAKTGLYPHENLYRPTSWNIHSKNLPFWMIRKQCYSLCMGGSNSRLDFVRHYNYWSKKVYATMGLSNPYYWKNKSTFIKERKHK